MQSSTGEPVPFASIQIKGTLDGGSTDADGNYSILVANDAVLIFSSIGYQSQEIEVGGRQAINVALHPDSELLDETIVVAFGTSTKESFTGSAAVVKSSDIAKVQTSDVTRSLEGVVAGVQMTTSSGSLGSSPSIMIRGISSINAGNSPLFIVDGVPYSGDMDNINPNDIESMTVLKDAASNALYGARGANGVIMITTKKAKAGEAVVNVDAKWGWNTKALKEYDYITDPCHFSPSRRLFFYTVKCVLCDLYYRTALIRAEISLYAVRAYLYHSAKHAVHRPDLHSRLEALQSAFMSVSIFFLFIHQHDEHYYTKDNCYY